MKTKNIRMPLAAAIIVLVLCCPFAYSQEAVETQEAAQNPVFSYYIAVFGPEIDVGFGFFLGGHELLFTPYISLFAPDAPFLFPTALGVRWSYQEWRLWPRYAHWIELPAAFTQSSFGQGFDFRARWESDNEEIPVSLNNYLFAGNGRFNDLSKKQNYLTLYDALALTVRLYQSSPFVSLNFIDARLSAHLLSLPDDDSLVYAFEISFPMNFGGSVLRLHPRVKYAHHNAASLLNIDNAVGYSFSSVSSFNDGALYNVPFGSSFSRDGNLQFSLSAEVRWYFLERLYLPLLSGLYLAAFSDIAYGLDTREDISSDTFGFAAGGGVGFKWTGLNFRTLVGYEYETGFRLNIALTGEL